LSLYAGITYKPGRIDGPAGRKDMDEPVRDDLRGLGGWLILVGIGVVLAPFRQMYALVPVYTPIFTEGHWEQLTTAGSLGYHPFWGPLIIGEILVNSVLVLVGIYLIYLFFSKHYLFPKVYVFLAVFSLVFIVLDAWLVTIVLPAEPMFDQDTMKEVTRGLVGVMIWVPYMLVSKRVRATFVERMPTDRARTDADLFA
jgi:hypothetical protein